MGRWQRVAESAVATAVLAESWRRARTLTVSSREEKVFRTFNDAPDQVHIPAWAVMQSGSLAAVLVVSGELVRRGRYDSAAKACTIGVATWAGLKKLKPFVGRGRPERHLEQVSVRGPAQTGLGYPSGHSAVSLTLALIVFKDASPAIRAAALAAAGITGGARMYVGAHLPLDVAGGFAIGVLCGNAVNSVTEAMGRPRPAI
jgi:membrane-associated phospholipid phosphatase